MFLLPIISGLLGPVAAATWAWIAGGGLVAGGAAVMLVSLVAYSDLGILHVLQCPVKTLQVSKKYTSYSYIVDQDSTFVL